MNAKLDILIPVYNEDKEIIKTIEQILSNVKCNFNIYICYDYDLDPSLDIIKKNFSNSTKIKFLKNNSTGFNQALITGIQKTNGEALMIFMADDHENFNIIDKCFYKFNESHYVCC